MSKLYIVRSGEPPTATARRYLFVESIPSACATDPLAYGEPLNGFNVRPAVVVPG